MGRTGASQTSSAEQRKRLGCSTKCSSQVRLDLGGKRGQGLGDECRGAEDATSGGYVGIT